MHCGGAVAVLRRVVFVGTGQARHLSSYQQEASHQLQASQIDMAPEHSVYNERELRQFLARFPGGSVSLEKIDETNSAEILIQNSGKRNAFTGQMMIDLADRISELEKWTSGRFVTVRGADGTFCTGGDFDFINEIADPAQGAKMSLFMQSTLTKLHQLPMLSAALIEGHALGGGAELAVACDFRLMTNEAKIGFVQSNLGVSTGWGGGAHLAAVVGPHKALHLLATGQSISAKSAQKMGLIDKVLENPGPDKDWTPDPEEQWWQQFRVGTTASMRAAKRIVLNAFHSNSFEDALNRERDIFTELWGSPAHKQVLLRYFQQRSATKKN